MKSAQPFRGDSKLQRLTKNGGDLLLDPTWDPKWWCPRPHLRKTSETVEEVMKICWLTTGIVGEILVLNGRWLWLSRGGVCWRATKNTIWARRVGT